MSFVPVSLFTSDRTSRASFFWFNKRAGDSIFGRHTPKIPRRFFFRFAYLLSRANAVSVLFPFRANVTKQLTPLGLLLEDPLPREAGHRTADGFPSILVPENLPTDRRVRLIVSLAL